MRARTVEADPSERDVQSWRKRQALRVKMRIREMPDYQETLSCAATTEGQDRYTGFPMFISAYDLPCSVVDHLLRDGRF
jgi:hypothetical protein